MLIKSTFGCTFWNIQKLLLFEEHELQDHEDLNSRVDQYPILNLTFWVAWWAKVTCNIAARKGQHSRLVNLRWQNHLKTCSSQFVLISSVGAKDSNVTRGRVINAYSGCQNILLPEKNPEASILDSGMCYIDDSSEAALRYGFPATLLAIQRVVHAYLAVPKNTYNNGDRHVLGF